MNTKRGCEAVRFRYQISFLTRYINIIKKKVAFIFNRPYTVECHIVDYPIQTTRA